VATRSESAQAIAIRKGENPKRARKLAQRKGSAERHEHHAPKRAGRKAIYALETG